MLDCALIGACSVIRANTVIEYCHYSLLTWSALDLSQLESEMASYNVDNAFFFRPETWRNRGKLNIVVLFFSFLMRYALYKCAAPDHHAHLGPVVQSVVSLTSSLRVISSTVLADSIHNMLKFFAEKMWEAFALQKLLTFFQQKISVYLRITRCKF